MIPSSAIVTVGVAIALFASGPGAIPIGSAPTEGGRDSGTGFGDVGGVNIEGARFIPMISTAGGAISAPSDYGARAGIHVLDRGGNAIEAMIAAAFAETVASPYFCGLGSDGRLVYYEAAEDRVVGLDFQSTSPLTADLPFYEAEGAIQHNHSHRAVGLPTLVKGFEAAFERFRSHNLEWDELIASTDPDDTTLAMGLAANGYPHPRENMFATAFAISTLMPYPASRDAFLLGGVAPYPEGATFKQPDLAKSLRLIADQKSDAIFRGEIGRAFLQDMADAHWKTTTDPIAKAIDLTDPINDEGRFTQADFDAYKVIWYEDVLRTNYRDIEVATLPGASGGPTLVETLNIIENFPIGATEADPLPGDAGGDRNWTMLSSNALHVISEATKIAHADRAEYLGDPAFVDAPLERLLSKGYATQRSRDIGWAEASYGSMDAPSGHTCHLSVIDRDNNAVALTFTVGGFYGSGVTVPGYGMVLNNQPSGWGRDGDQGAGPNAAGPGKRFMSRGTPTILLRDGTPILALGAAGGATIIMGVLQTITAVADFGLDGAHAVDAPQIGYWDWENDCGGRLRLEAVNESDSDKVAPTRIPVWVQADLAKRGHALCWPDNRPDQLNDDYAFTPAIRAVGFDPGSGLRYAAADPRSLDLRANAEVWPQGAMAQGVDRPFLDHVP